jgi:zinc metalloprotease ZmpB
MAHPLASLRRCLLTATVVTSLVGTVVAGPGAAAKPVPATFTSTARGTVFLPNPVQQTGLQSLTDRKDSDYAALQPAYRRVTLTDLEGSGSLTGRWVRVKSETGRAVRFDGGELPAFHRDADQFDRSWATSG